MPYRELYVDAEAAIAAKELDPGYRHYMRYAERMAALANWQAYLDAYLDANVAGYMPIKVSRPSLLTLGLSDLLQDP